MYELKKISGHARRIIAQSFLKNKTPADKKIITRVFQQIREKKSIPNANHSELLRALFEAQRQWETIYTSNKLKAAIMNATRAYFLKHGEIPSPREISAQTGLSERTVKTFITRMYNKRFVKPARAPDKGHRKTKPIIQDRSRD
ncbi:MAG: hypothetical protein HY392_04545 [Candidatus Diapherotrites archaeon]|nr:hypothetical protein [Candidatus Diapherotrites archaeon]